MMTLIEILSLNSLPFKKILTESTGPGKTIKLLDSSEVEKELSLSDSLIQLNFLMSDSLHKDFPLRKKITLYIKNYSANNIGFFEKYPDFGLWILFTCATVSVWFILSVIFFTDIFNYYTNVNNYYTNVCSIIPKEMIQKSEKATQKTKARILTPGKLIGFLIYSLILVALFIGIQFITVYDHSIVPANLFITNYLVKFHFFLITGGIISSFFFGGYLTTGEVLKEITLLSAYVNKEKLKDNLDKNKKNNLENASNAISKICALSLKNLSKYFYIASFILTAVVIVSGVLFSGINSLDISKLYKESFNQNFLNYDIIYLFGGLYSLLILFFYLPLRLTFSQVKEKYPEANNQDEKQETTKKSAFYNDKDFLNRLKETFTVSTPLLAALIQLIIDVLSNT